MQIRTRNKILRLTHVIFAYLLIDRLLHLNDLKSRMYHETGQMVKDFWDDVSTVYTDFADNDDGQLRMVDNTLDEDLKDMIAMEGDEINLIDAEVLMPSMCRKKVMTLFKIRRLMKDNMQVSGTHSHTPLNFVDVAQTNISTSNDFLNCNFFGYHRLPPPYQFCEVEASSCYHKTGT
jgi:hypothetical protein